MLRLSTGAKVILGIIVVIVLAFMYIPLFLVISNSFNAARISSWPIQEFSTDWWAKTFVNEPVRDALLNSVLVGLGATTLSMSATSASYTCQRSAGQPRARAKSRSSAGRRATRARRQPSAKQRSAKAWPMPLDAPVR